MNNGAPNCKFYGSMIGCRYGNNCGYSHLNPNSVPFCDYYNNCQFGNNCKFRHHNFNINAKKKKKKKKSSNTASFNMAEIDSKWMKLASLNNVTLSEVIPINDTEFIVVPNTHEWVKKQYKFINASIMKYNVNTDEWSEFIKYPDNFKSNDHRSIFNKDNQKLYLYSSSQIKIIDIKSQRFMTISSNLGRISGYCWVNTDKDIHLIGGYTKLSYDHNVWNDNKQRFDGLHKFSSYDGFLQTDGEIVKGCIVYIPSKKCIFLVGGYENDQDDDEWGVYHLNKIWQYSLDSKCWQSVFEFGTDRFSMDSHECILTSDEKYIIILGANIYSWDNDRQNYIFVLDISNKDSKQWKIRTTSIKRKPKIIELAHYVKTVYVDENSKLLVSGYIAQLNMIIPCDILKLIIKYFTRNEMIHCIQQTFGNRGSAKHYGLNVNDIIASME